jgi:hypothetical protein
VWWRAQVQSLVLVGVMTETGVAGSARAAAELGFDALVVADGCATLTARVRSARAQVALLFRVLGGRRLFGRHAPRFCTAHLVLVLYKTEWGGAMVEGPPSTQVHEEALLAHARMWGRVATAAAVEAELAGGAASDVRALPKGDRCRCMRNHEKSVS